MQACGNDYIFVNEDEIAGVDEEALAIKVSDRKNGIGSDGLIIAGKSENADLKMTIYNSDGSVGKMCGNGIRCLAKYAFERKMTIKTRFRIETASGIREVKIACNGKNVKSVKVNMGKPSFVAKDVPVLCETEHAIKHKLNVHGKEYMITCVNVGNPHAVIFVDDLSKIRLSEEGKAIENNKIFPDRVNVEFVQIIDERHIKMIVWERGSGETLACGTGACAAFMATYITGRISEEAYVMMPGGTVKISYDKVNEEVYLDGDANEVFVGEYMNM